MIDSDGLIRVMTEWRRQFSFPGTSGKREPCRELGAYPGVSRRGRLMACLPMIRAVRASVCMCVFV